MHDSHLLATTQMCKLKSIFKQSLGVGSGGDFEGFHDSRIDLVLYAWELSFNVLTNNSDVYVVVSVVNGGEGIAEVYVSV